MTGFNVNIQTHEGAPPELIIQYVLPLPAVLLGQSMVDIRNYINPPSATPSLPPDLTALKANFDTFAETRGSTTEETSALLATAKNALLTTLKKSLKKEKQTEDPLITEQAPSE